MSEIQYGERREQKRRVEANDAPNAVFDRNCVLLPSDKSQHDDIHELKSRCKVLHPDIFTYDTKASSDIRHGEPKS